MSTKGRESVRATGPVSLKFCIAAFLVGSAAAIVYGGEACFHYPPGEGPGGHSGRPLHCIAQTGCRTSNVCEGNCVDDEGHVYVAVSCDNLAEDYYDKCQQYPEAQCVHDGALVCRTGVGYISSFFCSGDSCQQGTLSLDCHTQF